jgi:GINS complex subunit 3
LDVLTETFRVRAVEIGDHAKNAGGRGAAGVIGVGGGVGTEGVEFLRGLDEWERGLFRVAHDSARAMRIWMGEVKKL